jgi:hypothetical protein
LLIRPGTVIVNRIRSAKPAASLTRHAAGRILRRSYQRHASSTRSPMTPDLADRFAAVALGHVTREYPNKLDHVLTGPSAAVDPPEPPHQDLHRPNLHHPDLRPRDLHPVFYGSFDWHSCVHGYWMLANLYRRFPAMPNAAAIRALFDTHLIPERIAGECAYLASPSTRGFERPYGWAWLLKLAAELALHETPPSRNWSPALQPLARIFADRFTAFLPLASYPVRAGVHSNTAFALRLALDYPDPALNRLLTATARRWYKDDTDCQAWEPGGDEFLSPTLIEAECMRAVLPDNEFRPWFSKFLPHLDEQRPATLFTPAIVSDRADGKIAHLDGLNLSRAWCWRSLADFTPDPEATRTVAQAHIEASLPHLSGNYMGEHWLCSFGVLALD